MLQDYADYLRDFYQTSELPVYNKWPPTPSKKYVNLAVISREEVSREELEKFKRATLHGDVDDIFEIKAPINLHDILDTKPGEKLQCVLVEGAPGVGKTTLAWEACKRWGKGELFQHYSMVMLLRLRDEAVQKATSITDLIFDQDKDCQQEVSRYLTRTRGKNTLIILEGLDELPQHLLTEISIFTRLLAGKILPQATVLVTSRPSATVQLWENWKERISRHIEVLGFTPQNITEYITSVVSSKQLSGFSNYLSINPHIKTMMYVPIHAAIVTEVYRCCQRSHKPIPTTATGLYTSLTQTILLRYLSSHPNYRDSKINLQHFTDLPSPVCQEFYSLTEMAYNGIMKQQLIFHDLDEEIQHFGFMDTVTELFPNQQSASYSYNFLHLSVQEYLAAHYASLKTAQEQEQLLKMICTERYLKNMGLFLAGITQFQGMDRTTVKKAIERECEKTGSLFKFSTYALQLLHESRRTDIMDSQRTYSCTLTDYSQPSEFSVLGHCIATGSYKWRLKLGEPGQNMQSTERVELLVQALKSHSNPDYNIVSIVCYYDAPDCAKQLLMEMPQNILQQLKELSLVGNGQPIPPCVFELILSLIGRLPKLGLSGGAITASEAASIITAPHSSLTDLNIHSNNIGDSGAAMIATALQSNHTLTRMNMGSNRISDRGASAIATALHSNSKLTTLDIGCNDISGSGASAIATALYSNSTLTTLHINDNDISDSGATAIATALHSNSTLTDLYINHNNITDSGAVAIADMLKYNNTVQYVMISSNKIGDTGRTALQQIETTKSNLTLHY